MEPVDLDKVRAVLEGQGALLGQRQSTTLLTPWQPTLLT